MLQSTAALKLRGTAPAELSVLQTQMSPAIALIAEGRNADAVRLIRKTIPGSLRLYVNTSVKKCRRNMLDDAINTRS